MVEFFLLTLLLLAQVLSDTTLQVDPGNPKLFLPPKKLFTLPFEDDFANIPADREPLKRPSVRDTRNSYRSFLCNEQDGEERRQSRLRSLRAARVALESSKHGRRRYAQTVRTRNRYFEALRSKYGSRAYHAAQNIAARAAAVGFPAPAVVYAVFTEDAVMESIPYDCCRRGRPGGITVKCEGGLSEGERWIEISVDEEGSEVWAVIGVYGQPCHVVHCDMESTEPPEIFTTPSPCKPTLQYTPAF